MGKISKIDKTDALADAILALMTMVTALTILAMLTLMPMLTPMPMLKIMVTTALKTILTTILTSILSTLSTEWSGGPVEHGAFVCCLGVCAKTAIF